MATEILSGFFRRLELLKAVKGAYQFKDSSPAQRRKTEESLAESLGRLKGAPQKVGQILAMTGTLAPDSPLAAVTYGHLSPTPWTDKEKTLRAELGRAPSEIFSSIDPHPLAVASFSQVHRGHLSSSGEEVAIKIQHRGIERVVRADLKDLGWVAGPISRLSREIDIETFRKAILDTFLEELDFERELSSLEAFHARAAGYPGLILPRAFSEYCTPRLLVTTFESGDALWAVRQHWSEAEKQRLAEKLVGFFFHALLVDGVFHADPHPGHYRFRRESGQPQVVLYDFGCMKAFPVQARQALKRWILFAQGRQAPSLSELQEDFLALSFKESAVRKIGERLPELIRALLFPFTQSGAFPLESWRRMALLNETLGRDRLALAAVSPEPALFVSRAFHGLLHALKQLGSRIDWNHAAAQALEET